MVSEIIEEVPNLIILTDQQSQKFLVNYGRQDFLKMLCPLPKSV